MAPRVFRGVGFGRAFARLASVVILYAGAFGVLWGLGLVVRGWQGWLVVLTPLLAIVAARAWAGWRVSVEIAGGRVRYEGMAPRQDWEVAIDDVAAIYFDEALRDRPLVLALVDGDERICSDLSPAAARALHAHLERIGVARPARPERDAA